MNAHSVEVRAGRVDGEVRVPGSKSETHRAFLLAAQSDEPSRVLAPLMSDDTQATLACLHALGARLHLEGEGGVQFLPAPLRPPREILDCRNSGTTLRLLTATCARFGQEVHLTGDASLRGRPNGALLDALGSLGATCRSSEGKAPLSVRGPLRAGDAILPPRTSSQFASALLLALAGVPGRSSVTLQEPVASAPYLDVTASLAGSFGVRLTRHDGDGARRYEVTGPQAPRAAQHAVAGDWSAAAFPLVAAAVTGGRVQVRGLRGDSPQGDRAIVGLVGSFGAKVTPRADGADCDAASANLSSPGTVDVAATPDLFPALAVLAACSRGTTTFTGGGALRHKESDRITAVATGLQQMGIAVRERPDGLDVTGGRLHGATVASLGDHRIHMAFAVAGLAATGTTLVDDPACAAVSWPGFHAAMSAAGAPFTTLKGRRTEVTP